MTQQEIQVRLNEASLMVSEANAKFLPSDTQARTGLELNPLWQMECLVRSGALSPDKQILALKTLAEYTHSKSPSLNQTMVGKPEDFLMRLAEAEFPTVEVEQVHKAAPGQGKDHAKEVSRRERWAQEGRTRINGEWRVIEHEQGSTDSSGP